MHDDDVMRPIERLMFAFSYIILPFLFFLCYPCSPNSPLVLKRLDGKFSVCLFLVIFGFPSPAEAWQRVSAELLAAVSLIRVVCSKRKEVGALTKPEISSVDSGCQEIIERITDTEKM